MAESPYSSRFTWEDYLVFSIMLLISSLIGLFFGIKAKWKKDTTATELLVASQRLPVLPVALSLSASFTSATTILGIPAEVYARGGEQWIWALGIIPCFLGVAFIIIPIFYRLQLTNAYEYLELRFNRGIRYAGSLAFSVIIFLYMAAVLFAPAVALSQVTGISREISIIVMGLVCTFYTAIGGIRAVVWTDAFQLVVVWSGLLALMFKGAEDVGGWENVWEIASNGSRLPRFDMDPDPRIRHTFWTLFVGGGFNMMCVYGSYQTNLQRYTSVRTLRDAKIALLLNLPIWFFYLTVLCLLGLVIYANFVECDPLKAEIVSQPDQLLPLFVLKSVGSLHGLPGLFVASIFSASISTLSSGINSLAAVTLEDVIKPGFKYAKHRLPSNTVQKVTIVFLVVLYGVATIGMAYVLGNLGKTALMISFSVFGMIGGPLLGLILNGILLPCINSWGAAAGLFTSLVICTYFGIDPIFNPAPRSNLPVNECSSTNLSVTYMSTTEMATTGTTAPSVGDNDDHFYLSYLHLATLAVIISPIVGILVSACSGFNKNRKIDERTYYSFSCWKSKESSYKFHHDGHADIINSSNPVFDLEENKATYFQSSTAPANVSGVVKAGAMLSGPNTAKKD